MSKRAVWFALGAASCLVAAAWMLGRASRRSVDDIDRMLRYYD